MTNAQLAAVFDEIADLLEFQGANPFRVRAYRKAAQVIGGLTEQIATIVRDADRDLTDIEGIGDDLAEKCRQLVATGALPMLDELREQVPATVLELMRIPGVGPKKAAAIHRELGISTLAELQAACERQEVRALKGFGAKTEQAILDGLSLAAQAGQRIYWADADQIAQALVAQLKSAGAVERIEVAGSYRRGKETVGDLDLLAVADDPTAAMDALAASDDVADILARGDTKMSVRLSDGLQVDLRVVPARSFGAALQYFTGSKDHNVRLRGMAKDRGLKVSEYGVFRVAGDEEEYLAGAEEADVYEALDLPCFPPEIRENRFEYDWAAAGQLPRLIAVDDLRGDLHMHTTETDGQASLAEMVDAARARGLAYIAITDHSQRVSMARGMDAARLRKQWQRIDELRQRLADEGSEFVVLKGIECDILEKGGMDLPDDVLAEADWVIASIHYGQRQPRAQITERILGALENPWVSMLAHPTGRLINRREPYEVDMEAVIAAAARQGKLLELNANPARLDLNDVDCRAAQQAGVPVVINTDAHSVDGLTQLRYGVLQARRAGLTKADVANTRAWSEMARLVRRG